MIGRSKGYDPNDDVVQISSWSDWFDAAGTLVEPVERYERDVFAYHRLMLPPAQRGGAYRRPHDSHFWRRSLPVGAYVLGKLAKFAFVAFLVVLVLGYVATFVAGSMFDVVLTEEKGIAGSLLFALKWGGIAAGSILFGGILVQVVRRAIVVHRLSSAEPYLSAGLRYFPPAYRNAFCLKALHDLHAMYGVDSYGVAVDAVNNHINNNKGSYVPITVLHDVAFAPPSEDGASVDEPVGDIDVGVGEEDDDGNPVVENAALPSDIRSHTHAGVADADKALDRLIGLDNVKKQVRQMRNRIQFYDGKAKGNSGYNLVFLGSAGTGKALDDDTEIAVNDGRGYVRIADLVPGDFVFGPDGKPTQVLGVYPQGEIAAYMVSFEDGSSLVCNDEHIFAARSEADRLEGRDFESVTVREMLDVGLGAGWSVPTASAIDRDGAMPDGDAFEAGREFVRGKGGGTIPAKWLDAPIDTRRAFLDGVREECFCPTCGSMVGEYLRISDMSLLEDLYCLVTSLGYRVSVVSEGGACYVSLSESVRDLKVTRIDDLGERLSMTCIYVDSESHLFLAGRDHVVTHNTEVARIMTKILYDFGYIRKNRLVEVAGDYLKSPYVGQTGERTNAIIEWSMGGVLFLDEAYTLFSEKDNSNVGAEAVGVLLKAMEDHRDDFVVIFAGYEDGINRLMASNEGFASRIRSKLYFPDYSADELGEIFKLFLRGAGHSVREIDEDALELLVAEFDAESRLPGFGNARAARTACDALLDIHADRFMDGAVDAGDKDVIVLGDVQEYVEQQKERFAADGRNFMATSHLDESIMSLSEMRTRTHKGSDNWEKDLEGLIGMASVKEAIHGLKDRADFFHEDAIADEDDLSLHMLFVGNPGTGKTTVAAIATGMLYDSGYIRSNNFVDVTGDFLKASYIGQTGKRTEAVIEYSKGMVLFIDEAYLLMGQSNNDFGNEALGVLMNAMEKARGELVVILAGYRNEMAQLVAANPGVASRIGMTVDFEDYSLRELMLIFQSMAAAKHFKVERAAWGPIKAEFSRQMSMENFGNARVARQMLQEAIGTHAVRWRQGKVVEDNRRVLESEDIVPLR